MVSSKSCIFLRNIIIGILIIIVVFLIIKYYDQYAYKQYEYDHMTNLLIRPIDQIPKVIYFCNKTLDRMEKYANEWKRLNPEYEISLYDNKMCEEFLLGEFDETHRDIFNFLQDGPIKADFWRICILYRYGGVYSDIDNKPLIPFDQFIDPDASFVTCSAYLNTMNFNPNLIISPAKHPILKRCIDWYIDKYNRKDPYGYWDWSIMRAFTDTLILENYEKNDGIYYLDGEKIQIIKECPGKHHYDAHNMYAGKRVFNNRYDDWDHENHRFKD